MHYNKVSSVIKSFNFNFVIKSGIRSDLILSNICSAHLECIWYLIYILLSYIIIVRLLKMILGISAGIYSSWQNYSNKQNEK